MLTNDVINFEQLGPGRYLNSTVKILKFGTPQTIAIIVLKIVWCNIALMHPTDADGMANSIDPDQTASSEAVWSWSALFAETYLSKYIEFVWYTVSGIHMIFVVGYGWSNVPLDVNSDVSSSRETIWTYEKQGDRLSI